MKECERLRPQLARFAEGEANPHEAIRAARHLSDCTACRIQLARERRLATMLEEGLDDPLVVGEDFVRAVMDNLPQEPPPKRARARRMLKLAGIGGLLALAPALAPRGLPAWTGVGSAPAFGGADLDAVQRLLGAAAGLTRALPIALDALTAAIPPVHLAAGFAGLAIAGALFAVAALGCAATVVAAATTGLLGRR